MSAIADISHDGDTLVLLLADCHRKLEESKRRADIKLRQLVKLRTVRKAADGLGIKPSSVMRRVQAQYNSQEGQLNEILGETLTIREEVTSMRSDRIALQTAIKRLRNDLDQHQQDATGIHDVQRVGESDGAGTAAADAKRGGSQSALAAHTHWQPESLDASNPDLYDSDEAPSPSKKRHHAPARLPKTSLASTPPPGLSARPATTTATATGCGGRGRDEQALAPSQSSQGRAQPEGRVRARGGAHGSQHGSRGAPTSAPTSGGGGGGGGVGFQTGAASGVGLHRTILQAVQDPRALPPGLQKSIEATDIKLTGGLGMKMEKGQRKQQAARSRSSRRTAVDRAVPSPRSSRSAIQSTSTTGNASTSTNPAHALPRLVSGAGAPSLPRSSTSASPSSSSSSSAAARARRLIMGSPGLRRVPATRAGALHAGAGVERKSGESLDLDVTSALARSSAQRGAQQLNPPDEAGFSAQLASPGRRITGARLASGQRIPPPSARRADAHAHARLFPAPRPPDESVAQAAVARTMRSPVVARWVRAREQQGVSGCDPGSSSRRGWARSHPKTRSGSESDSWGGEMMSGSVDGRHGGNTKAKTKAGPGQWAADVDAAALQQARRDVEKLRQAARGLVLALEVVGGAGPTGEGEGEGAGLAREGTASGQPGGEPPASAAASAAASPAARSRRASWDGQLGGNRAYTLVQRAATHLDAGSVHGDGQKGAPDALAGVQIDASSLQEASSLLEEHQRLTSSVGALWENVMSVAKACCGV